MRHIAFFFTISILTNWYIPAQIIKPLNFGNFESWITREVKESKIIGGKMKKIYVIGPQEYITSDLLAPFSYRKKTIWSSSNVYAKVAGIIKASNSVEPEERGDGYCARLDTRIEHVKVLGIINVSVLVSGSFFTGETIEPIKSTDDPYCNMSFGTPFNQKPKALLLDYKCNISSNNYVMKYPGVGSKKIEGIQDKAEIWIYLQKRWEDADGNIHALRVGTMRTQFDQNVPEWKNQQRFEIHYGDISQTSYYKEYMHLNGPYRARNSKGAIVPIIEEGWGTEKDLPTHMILMVTSGNQGAFIGSIGNTLWVDNLQFEY